MFKALEFKTNISFSKTVLIIFEEVFFCGNNYKVNTNLLCDKSEKIMISSKLCEFLQLYLYFTKQLISGQAHTLSSMNTDFTNESINFGIKYSQFIQ